MFHSRRAAALLVCFLAAVAVIIPAASAGAATNDFELTPGWIVHSATITCPGGVAPRALDGHKAAAFMQAWYPASLYGTLTEQNPPAGLPRCTFLAKDSISYLTTDNQGKTTTHVGPFDFRAFYVAQGNKAWIGLPPQVVGPGASVPTQKWYVATPRSILAWHGKVEPVSNTTTSTTTKPAKVAADTSSSSGDSTAVIIAVIAGVAILGVGAFIVRSRRKAGTT
jgi:hypothetical protein